MSEYCREWVADRPSIASMTRLPPVVVDEEPPSPALTPAPVDEEDHDDELSINSSDLDDEGWLNVDAASAAASTAASALGSSTISDFPLSSREPSEASASEDEDDEEPPFPETEKPKALYPSPEDSVYSDADTPAASNVYEFKNSWIFPDPTSSNASLTTTATITDNTPIHSLSNIRAVPHRSVESFIEEDESQGAVTETTAPVVLAMPAPDTKKKTQPGNPFLAHAARAEGKRWAIVPILIGLMLILMQLSPVSLVATIVSHHWGSNTTPAPPPAPPPARGNWPLGTADLQIVKDTLAALTTSSAVVPKDIPTEAPIAPSEYSYVWSKLRRSGTTSTDLIATTVTNSLTVVPQIRRRACQCPPKQCQCPAPASILDHLTDGLIAIDAYARWMSDVVTALAYHAGRWALNELELEAKYQRQLLHAFVKSPAVRVVVESAMNSPQTMVRLYNNARERLCANGRCERAVNAAHQAQLRGWHGILQARRGLDVALTRGQRVVDNAKAAGNGVLGGAVAGARSAGQRLASKKAEKKVRWGGCKEGKKRRRWSYKGKKADPNQRLQCGFRGYRRGCDSCDTE